MLPILVSLGPIKIYSYGVFFAIGLFISLYYWWKMGRDEHFDEIALFDAFFLAVMSYFVVGRLGYVVQHLDSVGTVYRAFAVLAYPGLSVASGIGASMVFGWLFARSHDWDSWKVADAYVVTVSLALAIGSIGGLLNGSNPVWQVNVISLVWAILTFLLVARVRKNFRFYSWYKGEASTAQEGLASLVFVLMLGIYYMIVAWTHKNSWSIAIIPGEFVAGIALFGTSIYVVAERIGRRDASIWGKLSNIIRRK